MNQGRTSRVTHCLAWLLLCAPLAGRAAGPWTQAELRQFARDLGDDVVAHHIQRNPKSPQDGMVFKWYRPRDGRWVLDTGQNMLGDGARFADALCLYHRATREPWALNVLKKYPLPFYEKVLTDSDRLFGVSKGICPTWWSDGTAVARGAEVVFDHVLLIGGDAGVQVGTPLLAGAKVHAQVVEQTRDNKVLIHKYRRRKNSRKTMGHRQSITRVRITQIEA